MHVQCTKNTEIYGSTDVSAFGFLDECDLYLTKMGIILLL